MNTWTHSHWHPVSVPRNLVLWFSCGITVAMIVLWYLVPLVGDVIGGKLFLAALPCQRLYRVPLWMKNLWAWLIAPEEPGFLPERIIHDPIVTDSPEERAEQVWANAFTERREP